jgi:hypothetical protein
MNPTNHFKDFFADKNAAPPDDFLPPPSLLIAAIMRLCSKHPLWYTHPQLRLMVAGGTAGAAKSLKDRILQGKDPGLTSAEAAFMMMVSDRLGHSYEEFASDEEKEVFPYDPERDPRATDDFTDIDNFDQE